MVVVATHNGAYFARMGLRQRLVDLNRGSFNGLEAAFYELLSAPAVREVVSPVLVEAVRDAPAGLVLDVGCGSGDLTRDLAGGARGVVGVDPSLPQLKRLRHRHELLCCAASAGALPFATGTFSAVVTSCSIKHWPSTSDGLSECMRVLSAGGALAIVEIDGGEHEDELVRFAARTRVPPGLRRGYRAMARRSFVPLAPDPADLSARISAAGLQEVRHRRIDGMPFFVVTARRAGPAER